MFMNVLSSRCPIALRKELCACRMMLYSLPGPEDLGYRSTGTCDAPSTPSSPREACFFWSSSCVYLQALRLYRTSLMSNRPISGSGAECRSYYRGSETAPQCFVFFLPIVPVYSCLLENEGQLTRYKYTLICFGRPSAIL